MTITTDDVYQRQAQVLHENLNKIKNPQLMEVGLNRWIACHVKKRKR